MWYLSDGHTRAFAAYLAGEETLSVERDPAVREKYDFEVYLACLSWCDEEGVESVADLRGRIVGPETFDRTDGTVGVNIVLDPEAKSTATERHVDICLDAGVEVFSFSFGDASPYIEELHDRGGTVMQTVGSADESETVFGTPFDEGWPDVPHRVLENETVERWEDADRPDTDRPGESDTVAKTPNDEPVRRYEDSLAVPEMDGDVEELPVYAGQSAGLADDVQPAMALVEELERETLGALSELPAVTRRRG